MTDHSGEASKDWITHEAHRVFEDEFKRHSIEIKDIIRSTLKEELHPRHGEHHIYYDSDLQLRESGRKGAAGTAGKMLIQALVIGVVVSILLAVKGAL